MARPSELKAEYFSHYTSGGKTIRALESHFGNDGYAFWFKLLERLCGTEGHYLDLSDEIELIDLAGYTHVSEEQLFEIVDLLVRLRQVDQALWEKQRIIWVQGLVDNLANLYTRRKTALPTKPVIDDNNAAQSDCCIQKPVSTGVSVDNNRQRREEYSIYTTTARAQGLNGVSVAETPVIVDNNDDLPPEMRDDGAARITDTFTQNIRMPSPIENQQLLEWLDTFNADVICYAIEQGALSGARTYRTVETILRRWQEIHVKDMAGAEAAQREWKNRNQTRGAPAPPVPKRRKVWIATLGGEYELDGNGKPIIPEG